MYFKLSSIISSHVFTSSLPPPFPPLVSVGCSDPPSFPPSPPGLEPLSPSSPPSPGVGEPPLPSVGSAGEVLVGVGELPVGREVRLGEESEDSDSVWVLVSSVSSGST